MQKSQSQAVSTSSNSGDLIKSTTDAIASSSGSSTSSNNNSNLPQGAEIKIPAVGATPVAVSTKLPAAVVQLTQQGMFWL